MRNNYRFYIFQQNYFEISINSGEVCLGTNFEHEIPPVSFLQFVPCQCQMSFPVSSIKYQFTLVCVN